MKRLFGRTRRTRTDWAQLRFITDAEIRAGIAADPDARPTMAEFWKGARLLQPTKSKAKRVGTLADFFAASPPRGSGLKVPRRGDGPDNRDD